MKIENTSRFQTGDIRRLVVAVARREGYTDGDYLRKLTVEVKDRAKGKRRPARGQAIVGYKRERVDFENSSGAIVVERVRGQWIRLKLAPGAEVTKVASIIRHEMAHNFGATHDKMGPDMLWCTPLEWAAAFPLRLKTPRVRIAATPIAKLGHAEKMLKRSRTRERLATTVRKRWEKRVRYFQRRAQKETP